MLVLANIVALAVMNHKPTAALYAGFEVMGLEIPLPPDGEQTYRPPPSAILDRNGAQRSGIAVGYTALIDNIGRSAFAERREGCGQGGSCPTTPWLVRLEAASDTPISIVMTAVNAIHRNCNVEVVVFTDIGPFLGLATRPIGLPLMFAVPGDERLDSFMDARSHHVTDQGDDPDHALMGIAEGESVDQFGERTGCARISPLRP